MSRYQGALNYKEKICSTLTPCGTFIITGSEDGNLYIWNAETSKMSLQKQAAFKTHIVFFSPFRDIDSRYRLQPEVLDPILNYKFGQN